MDAQVFWNVIGNYNEQTILAQICLFIFLIFAIVISYVQRIKWLAKFALGIANLYIARACSKIFRTAVISTLRICND